MGIFLLLLDLSGDIVERIWTTSLMVGLVSGSKSKHSFAKYAIIWISSSGKFPFNCGSVNSVITRLLSCKRGVAWNTANLWMLCQYLSAHKSIFRLDSIISKICNKYDMIYIYPYDKAFFFACGFMNGLPTTHKLKKDHPKTEDIRLWRSSSKNCILGCKIAKCPLHSCWRSRTAGRVINSQVLGQAKVSYLQVDIVRDYLKKP